MDTRRRLPRLSCPLLLCALALWIPASRLSAGPLLLWQFDSGQDQRETDVSGNGHTGQLLRFDLSFPPPQRVAEGRSSDSGGAVRVREASVVRLLKPLRLPAEWTLSLWIRDEREPGDVFDRFDLSEVLAVRSRVIGLDRPWHFRRDPSDDGVARGYHRGDNGNGWDPIDVPAFWHDTHVGRVHGTGWYTTRFDVPEPYAGLDHTLHFRAVDEQAWVYVNGEYVGEQTLESTGEQDTTAIWDRPFAVAVPSERLHAGPGNLLAVRSHARAGAAGIFLPVVFEPPDGIRRTMDLSGLSGPLPPPGDWSHVVLTVRPDVARLHINGELTASVARSLWPYDEREVELELVQLGEGFFSGLVDEVRLSQGMQEHEHPSAGDPTGRTSRGDDAP